VPPFELSVGPAATFAPASPTVHLAVGGAGDDVEQLDGLRRHLRSGPLDRPDVWPFVPHVTLAEGWPPERIDGVVAALAGVAARWSVTAVHLLTQHRDPAGTRSWVPVAEEPLGGPAVVGRGGVELVLRGVGMVEEGPAACCGLGSVPPPTAAASPTPWTVVAEPPGEPGTVLGAAVGRLSGEVAHLDALAVDAGHRGMGVGAQLLARWCSDAAAHGARTALAESESDVDGPRARFLLRHGFTAVGGVLIRRC
jgi:GNAT superfamily N-acetyltransferase